LVQPEYGVDTIMAEAGISKRTLYKYFESKDHLVDAVVQEYVSDIQAVWSGEGTPREEIMSLFTAIQRGLGLPGFVGCLAVRTMAEYGGSGLDVEASCQAFKTWERAAFVDMAERFGARDPDALGLKLTLIYEGMCAYTQVMRTAPPAESVAWVAELLDAETERDD
jgi:AcrR family transcriptional regulator